ncbi:hypothetical protein L598_002700000160 [Mesorhizobium sp. J18]|nr:hypothetical protein L598_002700000160 [Mesorhizobium sp. J18]
MCLASIDDRLKLGVRQEFVDIDRKPRPIAWLRRRDAGHGRRLHQLGRVRLRAGNTDRLKAVFLIDGIGKSACFTGLPVDRLIGERQALGLGHRRGRGRSGGTVQIAAHAAGRGNGRDRNRDRWVDGKPRRQMLVKPTHQRGDIRSDTGRDREDAWIVGGQFVDDGEARVDGRTVLGIDRAIDCGGKDDTAALLQTSEGRRPSGIVGREAGAGDRHQPSAGSKARQRRGDMAECGVSDTAVDIRHHREWRVHQHHARHHGRIEMIVDLGGVEARDGNGRKERREKTGAHVCEFVEHEGAAGDIGEDGEQAGAGRRLQHAVGRGDGGGICRDQAQWDRGRELLKALGFLGAPRVRWQQTGDLYQSRQARHGRTGFTEKRFAEFT